MKLIMPFFWFCASGFSFFPGMVLVIGGLLLPVRRRNIPLRIGLYFLMIIGGFLIFLSAAAHPWWLYFSFTAALLGYISFTDAGLTDHKGYIISFRILSLVLSLALTAAELPYHLNPHLPTRVFEKLYVMGDSVTAGLSAGREKTWSDILREKYRIDVVDLSEAGATVNTALSKAESVDTESAIVLLEIGGNDLFAGTAISNFERDLKALIEKTKGHRRMVVILELPLQPRHINYGMIQRRLAKDYDAVLIPKRFLAGIFSGESAAVDLAHLSPAGHEIMAEKIFSLLGDNLTKFKETENIE